MAQMKRSDYLGVNVDDFEVGLAPQEAAAPPKVNSWRVPKVVATIATSTAIVGTCAFFGSRTSASAPAAVSSDAQQPFLGLASLDDAFPDSVAQKKAIATMLSEGTVYDDQSQHLKQMLKNLGAPGELDRELPAIQAPSSEDEEHLWDMIIDDEEVIAGRELMGAVRVGAVRTTGGDVTGGTLPPGYVPETLKRPDGSTMTLAGVNFAPAHQKIMNSFFADTKAFGDDPTAAEMKPVFDKYMADPNYTKMNKFCLKHFEKNQPWYKEAYPGGRLLMGAVRVGAVRTTGGDVTGGTLPPGYVPETLKRPDGSTMTLAGVNFAPAHQKIMNSFFADTKAFGDDPTAAEMKPVFDKYMADPNYTETNKFCLKHFEMHQPWYLEAYGSSRLLTGATVVAGAPAGYVPRHKVGDVMPDGSVVSKVTVKVVHRYNPIHQKIMDNFFADVKALGDEPTTKEMKTVFDKYMADPDYTAQNKVCLKFDQKEEAWYKEAYPGRLLLAGEEDEIHSRTVRTIVSQYAPPDETLEVNNRLLSGKFVYHDGKALTAFTTAMKDIPHDEDYDKQVRALYHKFMSDSQWTAEDKKNLKAGWKMVSIMLATDTTAKTA